MNKIKKCPECGEYFLRKICPECQKKGREVNTKNAHPAGFSPEDRYGKYRRKLKIEQLGLKFDPNEIE